jgi:hypothetical protein
MISFPDPGLLLLSPVYQVQGCPNVPSGHCSASYSMTVTRFRAKSVFSFPFLVRSCAVLCCLLPAGWWRFRAAETAIGYSHQLAFNLLAGSLDLFSARTGELDSGSFALVFACLNRFRRRPHASSAVRRSIHRPYCCRSTPNEQKDTRSGIDYVLVHVITFFPSLWAILISF